jgi:hypothetical protein
MGGGGGGMLPGGGGRIPGGGACCATAAPAAKAVASRQASTRGFRLRAMAVSRNPDSATLAQPPRLQASRCGEIQRVRARLALPNAEANILSWLAIIVVVLCLYLAAKVVGFFLKIGLVLVGLAVLYWVVQPYLGGVTG